jgi:hypothetical protein
MQYLVNLPMLTEVGRGKLNINTNYSLRRNLIIIIIIIIMFLANFIIC